MITYRFTRREKSLLLALIVLLVALGWYKLVYEYTTNEMARLDGEIASSEASIEIDQTRLERQTAMKAAIERHKAMGSTAKEVPDFDNINALMTELDSVMKAAKRYNMSFDELDTESTNYVLRGVNIQFASESYEAAEDIISAIANGPYPCVIDTLSTSNNKRIDYFTGTTIEDEYVSSTVHVTFFERPKA